MTFSMGPGLNAEITYRQERLRADYHRATRRHRRAGTDVRPTGGAVPVTSGMRTANATDATAVLPSISAPPADGAAAQVVPTSGSRIPSPRRPRRLSEAETGPRTESPSAQAA